MTRRSSQSARRAGGRARRSRIRSRLSSGDARGPLEREARSVLAESAKAMAATAQGCGPAVAAAAEIVLASLEGGGTVFFCGNGGSAADAQHLACELAGRFLIDRPSLPAVALTTNTSSLTAIGNDFGYEHVFARQLASLGSPGDVLVAISTSGASPNVSRAIQAARRLGMSVIGFTGARGAKFAAECDVALITPHPSTPRVQEGHVAMGHALCELVERALFGEEARARALARGGAGTLARGADALARSAGERNGASRTRRAVGVRSGARGTRGGAGARRATSRSSGRSRAR